MKKSLHDQQNHHQRRAALRLLVGGLILLPQLATTAYARTTDTRYFCWAPFDTITLFRIDVVIGERSLSESEVGRRYRLPGTRNKFSGQFRRNNHSPQHIIDIIRGYESTHGRDDNARVTMTYTVNGHSQQEWRWVRR